MAQLEITDDQICKLDPASGCKARPTFFTQWDLRYVLSESFGI